jgi:hypothetical protein
MPDDDPLRRLGGGRWETKDGRFRIEPQSGTWVIVDAEQTDDLGLPLVRGPFRTLSAAREAIGEAREQGGTVSPLAELVEAAKARPAPERAATGPSGKRGAEGRGDEGRDGKQSATRDARPQRAKPKAREPAWLARLDEAERRRARSLLKRLERADVADAAAIARAEVVDARPAIARLALERQLRTLLASAKDGESLARAIVELLVSGEDRPLGVSWQLTDDAGRPIRDLSLPRKHREPA